MTCFNQESANIKPEGYNHGKPRVLATRRRLIPTELPRRCGIFLFESTMGGKLPWLTMTEGLRPGTSQ